MLTQIVLPETVHDESTYRVWQTRFYDFNVSSESKRLEKLQYVHGNQVKRRLVDSPADWHWSSRRFYHLGDVRGLEMDRASDWPWEESLDALTAAPEALWGDPLPPTRWRTWAPLRSTRGDRVSGRGTST